MKALGTGHSQGVLWRTSRWSARLAGRRRCDFTGAPPGGLPL
jgi:hypothetical protein